MSNGRKHRVGRHIRLGRERMNMTRQQVAEKAGCPLDVIAGLEAGTEDCSTGLLSRIAAALDMQLDIHFIPLTPSLRAEKYVRSEMWLREPITQRINFLQQLLPGIDAAARDITRPEWWRIREAAIASEMRRDIVSLKSELDHAI